MKTLLKYFLLIGLVSQMSTTLACTVSADDHTIVEDDRLTIGMMLQPNNLVVGQLFSLAITVCDTDKTPFIGTIKASATMPAHNHGMNYQPSFHMTSPGQFLGTGFVFHMPGLWRLQLALQSKSQKYTVEHDFQL